MNEFLEQYFAHIAGLCLITSIVAVFLMLYLALSARAAHKAIHESAKELYGIMKRIEGLTSGKREQILKEYDKIVLGLRLRLPTVIAAQASDSIFETESSILKNLAAIDPSIKDEKHKEKLDELIRTMEKLQETLTVLVSETVQKALEDARKEIASDEMTVV